MNNKFHIEANNLKTGEKIVTNNLNEFEFINDLKKYESEEFHSDDIELKIFTSMITLPNNSTRNASLLLSTRASMFKRNRKKVFLVHGHNYEILDKVTEYLLEIGLMPIILSEQPNEQMTLIEKLEKYLKDCNYGIVIYSKCDIGYEKNEPNAKNYRSRQNVVFEHGYLNGLLSRKNVCVIVESDDIELPSDIRGIVYTNYSSPNWKKQLNSNLKKAKLIN